MKRLFSDRVDVDYDETPKIDEKKLSEISLKSLVFKNTEDDAKLLMKWSNFPSKNQIENSL